MSEHSLSFGIHLGGAPQAAARELDPDAPFRILICGDFSGRANRGICQSGDRLATAKPLRIDRDNFDEILARLNVRVERVLTDRAGQPVSVDVRGLDDFHPDRLYAQVGVFESLRNTRSRLLDAATFPQAAAEVQRWGEAPVPAPPPSETSEERPAGIEIPGDLFDQMLANVESTRRSDTPAEQLQAMIQQIVAPYVVPGADPRLKQLVDCVDQVIGKTLQAILHHPDLLTLEANWRALQLLVRRLETGSQLQVFLVDVSSRELAADLAGENLVASGLAKLLTGSPSSSVGEKPWGLVVGAYSFADQVADIELLGRIAQVAAAAGTVWLSAAKGDVVGCTDPTKTPDVEDWTEPGETCWSQLQRLAAASSLGLTWPRFLTRMPYGPQTDPIESIPFEEFAPSWQHEELPWGNGAFLAALAVGEAFTNSGWELDLERITEINGLPSYPLDQAGETLFQTPGELILGERGCERIRSRGVIPVVSIRDHDALRVGSIRSINGQRLAGRW